MSYDAAGRLQEAINTDGERMKYSYNSRGLLTAYDVDGAVVNYDYDANGLLTAIRGPGDYYFGFKYDAAHRLIALLTPAGQAAVASTANPIQAARLAMTAEAQRTAKLSLVERLLIKAKSWLAKLLSFVVGEATANPALVETAVAPPIPAQAGGGVGGVSSGNRDLDELIGTSRPMLGADALLSDFNKSVRKIGNILGVTQSSSEACEDDSRCESAKQKAASIYHNLTAKRFPQYLSGGTRGSDKTHYETIKAKQSGLRDAIRRVRLYCRPLPAELPEWERFAHCPGRHMSTPMYRCPPYTRPVAGNTGTRAWQPGKEAQHAAPRSVFAAFLFAHVWQSYGRAGQEGFGPAGYSSGLPTCSVPPP